jgi:hypothetical protein
MKGKPLMSDTIRYAVVPSHTRFDRAPTILGEGTKVFVGYDVFEITGHNAEGENVFLWLKSVGWGRTLDEARAMMQLPVSGHLDALEHVGVMERPKRDDKRSERCTEHNE